MDFCGEYPYSIDAKNRLFIPVKFRKALGDVFYITRKFEKALIVYSAEEWAKLEARLERMTDDAAKSKIKQFIYPKTIEVTPDANGRVTLSPFLIKYAMIDKNVMVNGVCDHVEIWGAEEWTKKEVGMDKDLDLAEAVKGFGL